MTDPMVARSSPGPEQPAGAGSVEPDGHGSGRHGAVGHGDGVGVGDDTTVRGPDPAWPPAAPGTHAAPPVVDSDDGFLDDEWQRPPRANRLTWILVAALIAVLGFVGGVTVQKNHDSGLVGNAARVRAGGAGQGGTGQGGTGQGGTGGTRGGTGQGGAGPGSGGTGADAGGQGGGAASGDGAASGTGAGAGETVGAGTPVAVGTIKTVSGTTLTLTDFGGNVITVHVPPTATVTTVGLSPPAVGSPVSVVGTKAADGSVAATAVTVRSAGG